MKNDRTLSPRGEQQEEAGRGAQVACGGPRRAATCLTQPAAQSDTKEEARQQQTKQRWEPPFYLQEYLTWRPQNQRLWFSFWNTPNPQSKNRETWGFFRLKGQARVSHRISWPGILTCVEFYMYWAYSRFSWTQTYQFHNF